MGAAIVLGVVFVFLAVILAGLLRGLDWAELRRDPSGPLSITGVRGIVGGGFLVGLAYGLLVGGQSGAETWRWLSRGVVDGLVVACAGAFYVGFQQRKRMKSVARARPDGSAAAPEDGAASDLPDATASDLPDATAPPVVAAPAPDEPLSPDLPPAETAAALDSAAPLDPAITPRSAVGRAGDTEGGGSAAPPEDPVD